MLLEQALDGLRAASDPTRRAGMARYGIDISKALGVSIPALRALAKQAGTDHDLALALWGADVHEARILATMVADPALLGRDTAEAWARDFPSWDLCDQCCNNCLRRTPFAHDLPGDWASRPEEFVRRAGLVMLAVLAVHDKAAPDAWFTERFALVEAVADDARAGVKKAASWALRQAGKRNAALNRAALACAKRIRQRGTKPARWIASDVTRELESEAVQARLMHH